MTEQEMKLTSEEYAELAQLWHEYTVFGPTPTDDWTPMDFADWLNTDDDNPYGLPQIAAFLNEKERREGTALREEV